MRRIAEHLNELEVDLCTKAGKEGEKLATRFGLIGDKIGFGQLGGLHSRLLQTTLTAATQYEVRIGGISGSFDMLYLAWTCSRARLTKHENELKYLNKKLEKLEELMTTEQTWLDVTETWRATLGLLKSLEVQRGVAVLQCIASDKKLLEALGRAKALYRVKGDVPKDAEVLVHLNDGAGEHIRTHAYKYSKLIGTELLRIQRVKSIQWRALTLIGSAFVATMIGAANLFSRLYYDVLLSGNSRLAVILPVGAVVVVVVVVLGCCTCYYHRSLVRRAGRLRAPRHCRMCWSKKASVSPRNEAAAKVEAGQPQSLEA